MNEFDVLDEALEEYKKVRKLKKLNENLTIQLLGSLQYLLDYSKKYHIIIPKKPELLRMVENGYFLVQELETNQPKGNTDKINHQGNSTIFLELFCLWDTLLYVRGRDMKRWKKIRTIQKRSRRNITSFIYSVCVGGRSPPKDL